jgi:NAD(P)H-dependent FMN reductase
MKVQVIVGSIRQGRVTEKVAQWTLKELQNLPNIEAEIVDLAEYSLPLFDEVAPPQYNPNREVTPNVRKWLDKLAEAEAFVVVTPEYNRSFPGALKNAFDFIDFQFAKKPVAIVAHGSTGGAQAVASLRITLPGLQAVAVPSATFFVGRAGEMLDDSGELTDEQAKSNPYGVQGSLKTTLGELKWYGDALSVARAADK